MNSKEQVQVTSAGIDPKLLDKAVRLVLINRYGSVALIQRHLLLGYGAALGIMNEMARIGLVGEPRQISGYRVVLWSAAMRKSYLDRIP